MRQHFICNFSIINLILIFAFSLLLFITNCLPQGVAINTTGYTAAPSAIIDASSNSQGILIPRMTTTERNAINNPAEGLQLFNTTTKCFEFFANNIWKKASCGFTCSIDNLFDDRDSNSYQTLQIGTQCWMKENLKYLPIVHNNNEFATQTSNSQPGYGVHGYDGNVVSIAKTQINYHIYGVLYNWYAAMDGYASSSTNPSNVKGICPTGWHLPSNAEWKQLTDYISSKPIYWCGSNSTQIGKSLASTSEWRTSTTACTPGNNQLVNNFSNFSAFPSGCRYTSGTFGYLSYYSRWWSSTAEDASNSWIQLLYYDTSTIDNFTSDKGLGYAVRCLQDN